MTGRAPYYRDEQVTLLLGDALEPLRTLRDYDTAGQYGLESTPAAYVETMRTLFAEARRVLADDGTLWLNLGDSYSSGQGALNTDFNERWHGEGSSGQRKQEKGRPSRRR